MKTLIYVFLFSLLNSCATLSPEGKKVHVEVAQSTIDKKEAIKKLLSYNCKYIKEIEATILAGADDISSRLIMGLQNQAAIENGNAIITDLQTFGIPLKSRASMYSCPK